MEWWGAIDNLLKRQATRAVTGAGNPARAVAVADASSSGLSGTAPAAMAASEQRTFEGAVKLLSGSVGCQKPSGVRRFKRGSHKIVAILRHDHPTHSVDDIQHSRQLGFYTLSFGVSRGQDVKLSLTYKHSLSDPSHSWRSCLHGVPSL